MLSTAKTNSAIFEDQTRTNDINKIKINLDPGCIHLATTPKETYKFVSFARFQVITSKTAISKSRKTYIVWILRAGFVGQ
jgi:hypothetical protein